MPCGAAAAARAHRSFLKDSIGLCAMAMRTTSSDEKMMEKNHSTRMSPCATIARARDERVDR